MTTIEQAAEDLAAKIFYLPDANGKSQQSLEEGKKAILDFHNHWKEKEYMELMEKEPINFLLATSLRMLDDEKMSIFISSLIERRPEVKTP